MRALKDPFVQFLVLGGLVFLVYSFSQSADRERAEKRIAIDAPTQNWLYSNFEKQFRRAPTRSEMDALIRTYSEQEVKYRESLAMGLDERDSIVRRRMLQKFEFLFGNGAADLRPDDSILKEWYKDNSDDFSLPASISFTHLWFSPDARGSAVESDAQAALVAIQAGEQITGDRFPFDVAFDRTTRAQVRNVFGAEFMDTVFKAPLTVWSGPIASGLGYHLVHVTERTDTQLLPFEEVRDQVLEGWRQAESDRIFQEMLIQLRAEYTFEIDEESLLQLDYAPEDATNLP